MLPVRLIVTVSGLVQRHDPSVRLTHYTTPDALRLSGSYSDDQFSILQSYEPTHTPIRWGQRTYKSQPRSTELSLPREPRYSYNDR